MSPMNFSCRYCAGSCMKKGVRNGNQKLLCKSCGKYQQSRYSNKASRIDLDFWIVRYVKEGLGIRSISRILEISANTVLSRIIKIAKGVEQPPY